jgi:gamma-glutamyl:cysteine ligase YbdK (ATP-grasp superfamily)
MSLIVFQLENGVAPQEYFLSLLRNLLRHRDEKFFYTQNCAYFPNRTFTTERGQKMNTTAGIERERFIVRRSDNKIVPAIGLLLPEIHRRARRSRLSQDLFTYELFAGQVEDRTMPCGSLSMVQDALTVNDRIMNEAVTEKGLAFDFSDFVDEDRIASLQVHPFSERHWGIWNSITPERRLAASVVAAVHVHLSVPEKQVVAVLNGCRKEVIAELAKIGDHSNGKRIDAYATMSKADGTPPMFSSFAEVLEYIEAKGGEKNVWDLVRYKPSTKTIEFRMFGTTECIEEIIGYVRACLEVAKLS